MLRTLLTPLVLVAILLVTALGFATGVPRTYADDPLRGTSPLVEDLSRHDVDDIRRMAVVRIRNGEGGTEVEDAYRNATASTRFEAGSLTKLFTAEIYRQAVQDGVVTPDSRLGDLLDLGEAPVADVTLEELALHTSGLSAWGGTDSDTPDSLLATLRHENARPDIPLEELLALAQTDALETRGDFHYSNIGYALLGAALAEAFSVSYPALLSDRVTGPLEMRTTTLLTPDTLNPPHGVTPAGQTVASWYLGAYAPGGGALSSAMDIGRFTSWLLAESVLPDAPGVYRGFNAFERRDRMVLFKSGTTGGFRSAVALDPVNGAAVVLLCDTDRPVDDLVMELLDEAATS